MEPQVLCKREAPEGERCITVPVPMKEEEEQSDPSIDLGLADANDYGVFSFTESPENSKGNSAQKNKKIKIENQEVIKQEGFGDDWKTNMKQETIQRKMNKMANISALDGLIQNNVTQVKIEKLSPSKMTPPKLQKPEESLMNNKAFPDSPVYDRFHSNRLVTVEKSPVNSFLNLNNSSKKSHSFDSPTNDTATKIVPFMQSNRKSNTSNSHNFPHMQRLSPPTADPTTKRNQRQGKFSDKENIKERINRTEFGKKLDKKWQLNLDNLQSRFREVGKLGEGAFSVVNKVQRISDLKFFALKTYKTRNKWPTARGEAQILESLTHPGVVKYFGYSSEDSNIVLEFVEGDTLEDFIKKRGRLSVKQTQHFTWQILEAMEYCHEKQISHRDLKPANIIVTPQNKIKLIDFAFGIKQLHSSSKHISNCGTPTYMAPEVVKRVACCPKPTDVWSIGILMVKMLTGYIPFDGK